MNRTRGTVLGDRVALADTWWSRLCGLLGRSELVEGEGMLISPCDAIHMWWMSFSIDALFLDADGTVVDLREDLRPWSGPVRVPGARRVLEVPSGTIRSTRTVVGDTCAWTRSDSPRLQETP